MLNSDPGGDASQPAQRKNHKKSIEHLQFERLALNKRWPRKQPSSTSSGLYTCISGKRKRGNSDAPWGKRPLFNLLNVLTFEWQNKNETLTNFKNLSVLLTGFIFDGA